MRSSTTLSSDHLFVTESTQKFFDEGRFDPTSIIAALKAFSYVTIAAAPIFDYARTASYHAPTGSTSPTWALELTIVRTIVEQIRNTLNRTHYADHLIVQANHGTKTLTCHLTQRT